jgi:hypothetical protein
MLTIVEFIASKTDSDPRTIAAGLIAVSGSIAALVLVDALS